VHANPRNKKYSLIDVSKYISSFDKCRGTVTKKVKDYPKLPLEQSAQIASKPGGEIGYFSHGWVVDRPATGMRLSELNRLKDF